MSKTRLTFLGTGTSQGVPMIGCGCEVCRSADSRDKRLRASVIVEYEGLKILVDAGPDFRYQMLREGIVNVDAILLTHNHKDHTGGLDDIRAFNYLEKKPTRIYCEKYVEDSLRMEYSYAFATAKISLFDTSKGAMIELAGVTEGNHAQAEAKYADEVQDPVNAARKGYIDDIIEPQFVRSYLISALQLVTR